jgi:dTDP-4-dehydrorhamnose 3,5-epimerase
MPVIEESTTIHGLLLVHLQPFVDDRGRFMETFRKEWFPQRVWDVVQSNRSDSQAGVLRGLHYHHHQADYWYIAQGSIRAGLFDMRPSSPTYGATETVEMSESSQLGLFIPVGVAHGFVTLTEATLIYIVDNYYDGRDELGVAWNDPDIALDWGVSHPIVSPRDAANPLWQDIPAEKLPK